MMRAADGGAFREERNKRSTGRGGVVVARGQTVAGSATMSSAFSAGVPTTIER